MGDMQIIQVYHGSDHVIRKPEYLGGKEDNDYGNGFYTTEYEDRARSWAVLNGDSSHAILNKYELKLEGLKILDLMDFGILAWIAEVVSNRGVNQDTAEILGERLVKRYQVDSDEYDLIKGYRADDSYTQVIEAFLLNQLNLAEVERMFYKGSLGNQIFLKSEKAFRQIRWISAYETEQTSNYRTEDIRARREVNKFLQGRMRAILLDGYTVPGITAQYAAQHQLINHKDGDYYE